MYRSDVVKSWWHGWLFSLGYFTILPVRPPKNADMTRSETLGAMLFWFPLTGVLLGIAMVLIYNALSSLSYLGAVIAALSYPVSYGFIHTEAVADVADALYARHGGKDAYEVIKDPRIGAMGVLWSVTVLALKSALVAYALMHHGTLLILSVFIASRTALLVTLYRFDFKSAFVSMLKKSLDFRLLLVTLFFYALLSVLLTPQAPLFIGAAILFALFASRILQTKLGFLNGDTLGAVLEANETLLLFTGVLLWL
jgi:adenosylcobinamide-GDP ribazoletransferase